MTYLLYYGNLKKKGNTSLCVALFKRTPRRVIWTALTSHLGLSEKDTKLRYKHLRDIRDDEAGTTEEKNETWALFQDTPKMRLKPERAK